MGGPGVGPTDNGQARSDFLALSQKIVAQVAEAALLGKLHDSLLRRR